MRSKTAGQLTSAQRVRIENVDREDESDYDERLAIGFSMLSDEYDGRNLFTERH